ncbi:Pr6Pr family membrane protein [Marinimicrobium sp. C6131]|uniref:Pr6Pr family membrane protein n=1 Tax=Marinimicrobium sp. C6131 TaxID=3022676 RepID=UPI00223E1557|nr:Pr6Pr family membrane protein [Marinimicrobium sp. C6131]UZJ42948.1 Pr6Pr family membrane protein [Marinimicrobium sp. C6131]
MTDTFEPIRLSEKARPWLHALAALIWTTLALRLGLVGADAARADTSVVAGVLGSFGYFTVLTLAAAGLAATAPLLPLAVLRRTRLKVLACPGFATLVAAALVMVALVYTLVLRDLRNLEGLWWVVDSLLHDVIPVAFLLYWWFCVPKRALRYRQVIWWVCYPTAYLLVVMLLGLTHGWYPYPFLDVPALGPLRVRFNAVGLLGVYAALACLLVGVGRRFSDA